MSKKDLDKNIKIELDIPLPMALLLGTFIHNAAQGDNKAFLNLTDSGKKELMQYGQSIVDQVANSIK